MSSIIRCAKRNLDISSPQIMGVLNITPDSFSDGGRFFKSGQIELGKLLDTAQAMVDAGASIIDLGAESTRPGAVPVEEAEELDRVMQVLTHLTGMDTIISLDTRHASVARAAIAQGVHMINDVSAGADEDMLSVIANSDVAYALMHMQGTPLNMQTAPAYEDVIVEVSDFLNARCIACADQGIERNRLIVDPGFGFGKQHENNLQLLAQLEIVTEKLCGVAGVASGMLVGLSRKSMLGRITGRDVDQRSHASVVAAALAVQNGANILRVHDVAPTRDMLQVLAAVGKT